MPGVALGALSCVILADKSCRSNIMIQPIRAQYLGESGPMRVFHSDDDIVHKNASTHCAVWCLFPVIRAIIIRGQQNAMTSWDLIRLP